MDELKNIDLNTSISPLALATKNEKLLLLGSVHGAWQLKIIVLTFRSPGRILTEVPEAISREEGGDDSMDKSYVSLLFVLL